MDVGGKGRGREMKSFNTLEESQNFRLQHFVTTTRYIFNQQIHSNYFHKECKNLVAKIALLYIGGVKKIFYFTHIGMSLFWVYVCTLC
jgi:hypothetical protein